MAVKFCLQANTLIKCCNNNISATCDRIAKVLAGLHPTHKDKVKFLVYPMRVGNANEIGFYNAKAIKNASLLFYPFSAWNKLPNLLQKISVTTAYIEVRWII